MSKIGRNERCPCGSGRKYKHCCLIRHPDGLSAGTSPVQNRHGALEVDSEIDRPLLSAFGLDRIEQIESLLASLSNEDREFFLTQGAFWFWTALGSMTFASLMRRTTTKTRIAIADTEQGFAGLLLSVGGIQELEPYSIYLSRHFLVRSKPQLGASRSYFDSLLSSKIRNALEGPGTQYCFVKLHKFAPIDEASAARLLAKPFANHPLLNQIGNLIAEMHAAHLAQHAKKHFICAAVEIPAAAGAEIKLSSGQVIYGAPIPDSEIPHAMIFEQLVVILKPFDHRKQQPSTAIPCFSSVYFYNGFGAFASELAHQSQMSLLEVTFTLLQNPIWHMATPHGFYTLDEKYGRLVDYARATPIPTWQEFLRNSEEPSKFAIAEMMLNWTRSVDPAFEKLFVTMKCDTSGRLVVLFRKLWSVFDHQESPTTRLLVPTTKQMEEMHFTKKAKPKPSSQPKSFMGSVWTLRRSGISTATPDDMRVSLAAARAVAYSRELSHMRGYELPFGFDVKISENRFVALDKIQIGSSIVQILEVSRDFLLGSFQDVEEAIRWAHFEMLEEVSLSRGADPEAARQEAARRTGLILQRRPATPGRTRTEEEFVAGRGTKNLSEDERRTLEKVNKLFQLANSSYENEAELAMERAHSLLRKSRLERFAGTATSPNGDPFEAMMRLTLFTGNKTDQRLSGEILRLVQQHYGVKVIHRFAYHLDTCQDEPAADILGPRVSVLMAEHVIDFLCRQVDIRWREVKESGRFQARQRLSFQIGIIRGFSAKLAAQKRPMDERTSAKSEEQKENVLIALERDILNEYTDLLFPSLKEVSKNGYAFDRGAFNTGHEAGSDLVIHIPLGNGGLGGEGREQRPSNNGLMIGNSVD